MWLRRARLHASVEHWGDEQVEGGYYWLWICTEAIRQSSFYPYDARRRPRLNFGWAPWIVSASVGRRGFSLGRYPWGVEKGSRWFARCW